MTFTSKKTKHNQDLLPEALKAKSTWACSHPTEDMPQQTHTRQERVRAPLAQRHTKETLVLNGTTKQVEGYAALKRLWSQIMGHSTSRLLWAFRKFSDRGQKGTALDDGDQPTKCR